ncbi:hypothetical protein [Acidomonas methanolica]|uniref:hypothetical protein n=1 Tax=Acidomonas methanolica TaxID=437 RepID=UPI0010451A92|nr:hypothetical protein [Acidomonas methanolica]MBU2655410.1 hypothetical protein [Acidomonas methanolica]MCQ9156493.1 hypothetical protein [Acidomonas methanolica]GBQ47110.1 hypothetical protein AA0498_0450 [Acidomonas methanolica]
MSILSNHSRVGTSATVLECAKERPVHPPRRRAKAAGERAPDGAGMALAVLLGALFWGLLCLFLLR